MLNGLHVKNVKYYIKKRKDCLETRTVLLTFLLELEISGVDVQGIIKTAKMAACSESVFCGDYFDVVSAAIFLSYSYSVNASEAVQEIATDDKRFSQILLVRYSLHSHINYSAGCLY